MRYSGLKVITEGLFGNKGWKPAWRDPAPKPEYDVVIIGGGGHGLSTAYYLAKKGHAVTVFDALPAAGGMARYGIPSYRVPLAVIDQEVGEVGLGLARDV